MIVALAKKPIESVAENLRNRDCVKCTKKSADSTFCWNKQYWDLNKEMFGICVDDGECPSGHEAKREVNKCPIEPSNVKFKDICTCQGNVYGMSSNAPRDSEKKSAMMEISRQIWRH